ncbi:hypothetical protein E2C01_082333 [Portunus trituberculatus]|uniref:Uncharacterized protein n=1 Tax=Portunus trituberculatus TaxID=210409 RepID=A0A5B7IPN3_PORTR|nr:hypothetical protein [Portunus trituberculatus]
MHRNSSQRDHLLSFGGQREAVKQNKGRKARQRRPHSTSRNTSNSYTAAQNTQLTKAQHTQDTAQRKLPHANAGPFSSRSVRWYIFNAA